MLIVRDVVDSRVRLCEVCEMDSFSLVFNSTSGSRANFVYLWKFKLQLVHVLMFRLFVDGPRITPQLQPNCCIFAFTKQHGVSLVIAYLVGLN